MFYSVICNNLARDVIFSVFQSTDNGRPGPTGLSARPRVVVVHRSEADNVRVSKTEAYLATDSHRRRWNVEWIHVPVSYTDEM